MTCLNCGSPMNDGDLFCKRCGAPSQPPAQQMPKVPCVRCGKYMPQQERFCQNCGADQMPHLAKPGPMKAPKPEKKKKDGNKTLLWVMIVLIVVAAALAGYVVWQLLSKGDDAASSGSAQSGEITQNEEPIDVPVDADCLEFEVYVYGADDVLKEHSTIETEETYLLDALKEADYVSVESGMLVRVGDQWADPDEGESWLCQRSGESAQIDLETCYLEDGDVYVFSLQEQEVGSPLDLTWYIGDDLSQLQDLLEEEGHYLSRSNEVLKNTDGTIDIRCCECADVIHVICIQRPMTYILEGVYPGMKLDDAIDSLEARAYREDRYGSAVGYDFKQYYDGSDCCVRLTYDEDETVIEVMMFQPEAVPFREDSCGICAPAVAESDYLLPESAERKLTYDDLEPLTHEELCFARNEIYARHGRIFAVKEVAEYFESKSWYHGTISPERFSVVELSEIEKYNAQLIKDYENTYYGGSYY